MATIQLPDLASSPQETRDTEFLSQPIRTLWLAQSFRGREETGRIQPQQTSQEATLSSAAEDHFNPGPQFRATTSHSMRVVLLMGPPTLGSRCELLTRSFLSKHSPLLVLGWATALTALQVPRQGRPGSGQVYLTHTMFYEHYILCPDLSL